MCASPTTKTRLEDWQDRRKYLESLGGTSPNKAAQIKVLDYLIKRYRDSESAHVPARFPLRTDLYWNDRRIAVHHHLGHGNIDGVQTRDEAEQRIRGLVQRMVSDERHGDGGFAPMKQAVRPCSFHIHETVREWRDRIARGRSKSAKTSALEDRIRFFLNPPIVADLIRELLADDVAQVRVAASLLIADIGDLDDIALLSDRSRRVRKRPPTRAPH